MAWTADRALAEWFRDRYPGGKLWTTTVSGADLLASYDGIREGLPGEPRQQPRESEFIVDPTELLPQLLTQ